MICFVYKLLRELLHIIPWAYEDMRHTIDDNILKDTLQYIGLCLHTRV